MNRIISATIAAGTAAVMLFASCQRDELQGGSISGEEVSVSISATMPIDGGAVVKSNDEPGNASEVNRCIMGVYLNDDGMSQPEPMGDKVVVRVDGTTHKAEFGDLQLVSGHKYLLVFWADNATEDSDNGFEDNHYNTADFPEVTFKGAYKSNDDTRDAFFASYPIEVNGPSSHDIELHRPFGQLNITTNDYRTVADDFNSLLPTQVKIDFSDIDIPTGIDLLTGELTEDKESSLVSGPVDIADVSYPIAADGSRQLSFDYIFAPYEEEGEEQQLVLNEFKMHFYNGGQETISAYTFQNIPVRRNYRTNVSGNLLTDRTGIDVEVVPDFNEPAIEINTINTEEELVDVLTNGGDAVLTGDITVSAQTLSLTEGETASLDLDGHTITFNAVMTAENASVTFTDGTIVTQNLAAVTNDAFEVGNNGSLTLDGITFESNGCGVGIGGMISNGSITVRNSTMNVAAYAVATNASLPYSKNVKIVLENSTFTGSDPVFVNIPADVTIKKCSMTGTVHGMILRGGNANVEDCTITLHYTDDDGGTIGDYFNNKNWGSGNMLNIAGLTVGNKLPGAAYQYPSSINLVNTVVEVTGPYAGNLPAMYVWANEGDGLGVTITYNGVTKFYGDRIYGNNGANITVNGAAAVSDEGDTRP